MIDYAAKLCFGFPHNFILAHVVGLDWMMVAAIVSFFFVFTQSCLEVKMKINKKKIE